MAKPITDDPNANGWPKTPGLPAAAKSLSQSLHVQERYAARSTVRMAGPENIVNRIERALDAADRVHDLARELNDGPNAPDLSKALSDYRKAVRGLDLRSILSPRD